MHLMTIDNLGLKIDRDSIFKNLSFKLNRGEIHYLMGESGAGKSLVLKTLLNFNGERHLFQKRFIQEGQINYHNLKFNDLSYVPQSIASLNETMTIGKLATHLMKIKKCQNKNKIEDLFHYFELDKSVLKKYPFELSGGMAKRVLFSLSLLLEPKVLLVDEPTLGLDENLSIKIFSYLDDLAGSGMGIILISHETKYLTKGIHHVLSR